MGFTLGLRDTVLTRPDGTAYALWSFGVLHISNPVRQAAIRIIQWPSAPRHSFSD